MRIRIATFTSWLALVAVSLAPLARPSAAQGAIAPAPDASEALAQWLRRDSIPIATLTAGSGFEDLEPLREALDDVRIVGLGEATHGTREFFQFKHRMVEFLVREMGFTVLALEVQYMKCLAINDYVLDGSSTADAAALVKANLSGIYQTEEVLALVEWMHSYNSTVPPERRVRFCGFDVQSPHLAADKVVAFLKRVDPARVPQALALMRETAPTDFRRFWLAYGERSVRQKARLRARLLQLLGSLTANQARYVRRTSAAEFDAALQAARILVQSDEIRSVPEAKKQTADDRRDRNMADTVAYLLQRERPGTKIVLWGHNFHLWTMRPDAAGRMDRDSRAELSRHQLLFRSMGSYLREDYGDGYYAFGFVFDEGSFQAIAAEAGDESMEPLEFTLGPSPEGSLGQQMASAAPGDYVVDLRRASTDRSVATWLESPRSIRYAGADFSRTWTERDYSVPAIPREHFDGLVFIRKTSRARPL